MKAVAVFISILVTAFFAVSCSKGSAGTDNGDDNHNPNPSDTTAPELTVNTPVASQVFNNGNTISVTGRITDNLGLYRGSIRIVNDADGVVVKEQLYEIHGLPVYNFNLGHIVAVPAASDYTVTVWFEDHGYNGVTKSVKIKVNP